MEFRVISFEPGVRTRHTLGVRVTEFACYEGPHSTIETVTADVRRWE